MTIPALALRTAIRGYQLFFSWLSPGCCRYVPSCSRYALDALALHGAGRGSLLTARRLLRCHPWGGSGLDPVPAPGAANRQPASGSADRRPAAGDVAREEMAQEDPVAGEPATGGPAGR